MHAHRVECQSTCSGDNADRCTTVRMKMHPRRCPWTVCAARVWTRDQLRLQALQSVSRDTSRPGSRVMSFNVATDASEWLRPSTFRGAVTVSPTAILFVLTPMTIHYLRALAAAPRIILGSMRGCRAYGVRLPDHSQRIPLSRRLDLKVRIPTLGCARHCHTEAQTDSRTSLR